MSLPTVSVCVVARDDKPFLQRSLAQASQYADEVVVIDNGSTDGSWEWLQECKEKGFFYFSLDLNLGLADKGYVIDGPRPKIVIEQADPGIIPELGFSFLKNKAAQLATCDWIHSLDADECLDPKQVDLLKPFLKYCKPDVVSIVTRTFKAEEFPAAAVGDLDMGEQDGPCFPPTPATCWNSIAHFAKFEDTTHRRIYRRGTNVEWRGYIHEELYQGEKNAMAVCQLSEFRHLHFTNFRTWADDRLKRARYSWMLLNAHRHTGLQTYTNRWWYSTYVPKNLADIEHWAGIYEELKKEGKV